MNDAFNREKGNKNKINQANTHSVQRESASNTYLERLSKMANEIQHREPTPVTTEMANEIAHREPTLNDEGVSE
ncbi:aerobic respiration two-component sensor histidine kinase ArcB [Sesbania bispinosa]|nr:aerobic respiration two-component sensor histidine kinase ArcB [Sesbania bispinosa]